MTNSIAGSSSVACGACGSPADQFLGAIYYYIKGGGIQTPLWRCSECGSYTRDIDVDDPRIRTHFEVASYTDLAAEDRLREIRISYFRYLMEILQKHAGSPPKDLYVLDVGSAYGHFLELLRDEGARAEGVEIVDVLRERANSIGLTVHATIPQTGAYNAVTAIDCVYLANDPLAFLKRMRVDLRPNGVLVVRVTNRVWLFDALRVLGIPVNERQFGDAKVSFTPNGIVRLMQRAGFRVERVIWREVGKADTRWLVRVYYRLSPLLSEYLSLRIAPGMILVARPA